MRGETAHAGALFLSRDDIERLLKPDACAAAVESAFRQQASGQAVERILGLHARDGSFHVKAGLLMGERPYFAAKVNANFPRNSEKFGLPTIQGLVILHDGVNGSPLAILDSISITALRNGNRGKVPRAQERRIGPDLRVWCASRGTGEGHPGCARDPASVRLRQTA
jgi:ornithine cyclodeaminase/alanine dehydrogenase-like protein (mu-crystallin family)